MAGLKTLTYYDRAAQMGKTSKKITFDQAIKIAGDSFEKINPIFRKTFEEFLQNGQIDAFPKIGKHGGAYCSHGDNMPTMFY
jgi:oligoendopeptidase F